MRPFRTVPRFDKDLKLVRKRGLNVSKLQAVVDLLRTSQPLPPARRDHELKGSWRGYRECHIGPDWLLIYRDAGDMIVLERTGTHSDLFG